MIEDFAFVFAFVARLHPLRITFVYHFCITYHVRITFVSRLYHFRITFLSLLYHVCKILPYVLYVSLSRHFRIRISNSFRISIYIYHPKTFTIFEKGPVINLQIAIIHWDWLVSSAPHTSLQVLSHQWQRDSSSGCNEGMKSPHPFVHPARYLGPP